MAESTETVEGVTKSLAEVEIHDPHEPTEDVRIINLESHVADDIYFTDESFKMLVFILHYRY